MMYKPVQSCYFLTEEGQKDLQVKCLKIAADDSSHDHRIIE